MNETSSPAAESVRYSTVTGYFLQDEESTDPTGFDFCYWSLRDGNETLTWADALLTPTGEAQALRAHDFWESAIRLQKIPTPESYYASPLLRCLATANLTFSGLDLPKESPFVPTIKEGFREVIGVHTCDRRSAKAVIKEKYPDWSFEENFAEEDPLWSPTLRETDQAIDQRTAKVLEDVWAADKHVYISVSAHSGEIAILNHRPFPLGTGQAIPILIKAEKVPGKAPPPKDAPWVPVATCSQPPA
ncbi:phosphoglycerate mutase family protein [Diplocarpon rosae]|nr:phosphoglycerate mutase family protein [Diplocarpon rosae]